MMLGKEVMEFTTKICVVPVAGGKVSMSEAAVASTRISPFVGKIVSDAVFVVTAPLEASFILLDGAPLADE
jgi:hypothetical protein